MAAAGPSRRFPYASHEGLIDANRVDHEGQRAGYRTLRESLTDLEVVEVYWQLGDVLAALGQADRAQNHFEKALAIDPGHEPSLRALVGSSKATRCRWSEPPRWRRTS